MNRLTEKDAVGSWRLKGIDWQQLRTGQTITKEVQEKLYGALWKLMKYEETGLEPLEAECLKLKDDKGWIPVIYHEITDEERKKNIYPKHVKYYLDGPLPEDEQEIIVTNGKDTWVDICRIDSGEYYLEGCHDWIDITAWMPMPAPEGRKED